MFDILRNLIDQQIRILLPGGSQLVTVVGVTETVASFRAPNLPPDQNNITMAPSAVIIIS